MKGPFLFQNLCETWTLVNQYLTISFSNLPIFHFIFFNQSAIRLGTVKIKFDENLFFRLLSFIFEYIHSLRWVV